VDQRNGAQVTANIVVERSAGIVRVTLNRPQRRNAMLPEMWAELTAIFEEIEQRSTDQVAVLAGADGSFCSGADVAVRWAANSDLAAVMSPGEILAAVKKCTLALTGMSKPTVAAVDGIAAGGGCNLALACDLVVASDRARFSEIFVRRGLTVDTGGSWILPRLVGSARARRLILLGEIVEAQTAFDLGLITHLFTVDEFDREVTAIARQLTDAPGVVLAADKKLLAGSASLTLEEALDRETQAQLDMMSRPHVAEAMREFLASQAPATTAPPVTNNS
jgi:2-(1,2-epoxy-1,2-dihydrophenyl)acetyl-CoA isomerase